MARIRSLKPEFFKDEDLAVLPFESRLFFAGLWCFADKAGRLEYRPKYLKAEIFPYDDIDVEKLLVLLSDPSIPERPDKTFIRLYTVDGKKYIEILEFAKHQSPHHTEKDSELPPYNGEGTVKERLDKGKEQDAPISYPLSYPQSESLKKGDARGKKKNKEAEEKFLHLRYVFLTEKEHGSLLEKLGEDGRSEFIERLDRYIAQIGVDKARKKYVSHYDTILNWHNKDLKEKGGGSNGRKPQGSTGTVGKEKGTGEATPGKYAHLSTVIDVGGEGGASGEDAETGG